MKQNMYPLRKIMIYSTLLLIGISGVFKILAVLGFKLLW